MNTFLGLAALGIICALTPALSQSALARTAPQPPLVMGYYSSYDAQIPNREIHPNRFADVIYSFATADESGDFVAASCAQFPDFVKTVHAKNLRAVLALSGGGNGADFAKMANDTEKRAAFVAAIGMKAANPNAKLMLVVGAGAWSGRSFDGAAAEKQVDLLRVMTYDFHGPWNVAGHHTNVFDNVR